MKRETTLLTVLILLALLLPALPARAVATEVAPEGGSSNDLPFDPAEVVQKARNAFHAGPAGLYSDNGRRRVELDDWGLTFTPYVDGELHPEHRLGFRLLEARRGNDALYTAPLEGGSSPAPQEEPVRAGYARPAGVSEVYLSLDFAVEQLFVIPQPLSGTGDLVLLGALSTTLAPLQEGSLEGAAVFPLGGGNELFYGPAVVRDDEGAEAPVELWLDDGEVRLTVPGDWLAEAAYPVVVDPLIGSEITVSSASYDQKDPVVATSDAADAYRYLVVWADYRETNNWQIYGQIVQHNGTLQGSNFPITDDGYNQTNPAIAYDTDGDNYLVVYEDDQDGSGDVDVYSIRVPYDGNMFGIDPVEISDGGSGTVQEAPAVTISDCDDDYCFLVTWTDHEDDSLGDIKGRFVTSGGSPQGSVRDIGTAIDTTEKASDVAYSSTDDKFLVVWERGSSSPDIYGRRVDPNGDLFGNEITISSGSNSQQAPVVAYNGYDNEYLVAWEDERNSLLTGWDIYGQRVEGDGDLATQGNFAINSAAADQRYPDVAHHTNVNEFLVAWVRRVTADMN